MTHADTEDLSSYFALVGMGGPLVDRALGVADFYHRLLRDKTLDVFVSEYVDTEGQRQYESLWLLSTHFLVEAHNFVSDDRGDIVPLERNIARLEIGRQAYDFVSPTADSRLSIELNFATGSGLGITANLKASDGNCDRLAGFVQQYFLPNVSAHGAASQG